jgi:hypothetical protein
VRGGEEVRLFANNSQSMVVVLQPLCCNTIITTAKTFTSSKQPLLISQFPSSSSSYPSTHFLSFRTTTLSRPPSRTFLSFFTISS